MRNKDVAALIKMSTFAAVLCAILLVMGNVGLTSSLPVFVMNHVNIIHVGFYLAFNAMFIGLLGLMVFNRQKAVRKQAMQKATA
ncbi:phenylalanyl-tRNA synthetase subunit alpha [Photobacterium damselae]|uniref:phenylalanyl-tRNA synthetase subunit alpha n=1 Tax=Photobacterium damselae TaxID=38293 RepID=UPI004068BD8F